ncbi:2-amino-3-ketobutyrate coenzyme A ligase, mitochondrial-like [Anneissia japonica]|uniref:2-amino-3-ketobutyrate coenzyme A ligase, mitochondrial-like n=1 Tax=Anneissia japonica TaxID=1529436 RepID=UPI001425549A|nr:2-amino-3-ketobutyrate coenzyme A ligase, mitochondrial-like [Anneissia japonica]XP_033106369.1 2-amino-3-ketobutyrate coenzyme A ligase, mitochondrial-like [Anneissia japonica]
MSLTLIKRLQPCTLPAYKYHSYSTAPLGVMNQVLGEVMDAIRSAGTYKPERVITTKQAAQIKVKGSNRNILNFCANNYLGLSSNLEVVEAAKESLDRYGNGLSSVRFICGTQDIHKELEQKIAKFHGRDDAILYISCFDANAGIFESLLGPEDAVISDELNHASIIDGIRLCRAERLRYYHMSMPDLEQKLQETQGSRMRLIVTDGVFSMDGDVAPLKEICDLADKYNSLVFIDECHATGFLGATGRGTEEFLGLDRRCHIINSTLGKALGGAAGGYTTGPQSLIDMLRQKSRPYLFSNSLPPPIVASASKVFDLITKDNSIIAKVTSNTKRFRDKITAAGFEVWGKDHPICPIMLGDASLAGKFAEEMLERDIYVIGFSFPVVPKGLARIRVQISAAHTEDEIDRAVDAFIEVGKKLGVIP